MRYFLYFLRCQDNSIYIGISNDVEKRFLQHQQGKGAKYTRSHPVLGVIASLACEDKSEALRLECFSKSWSKKQKELFLQEASIEKIREKYQRKKRRSRKEKTKKIKK